MTGQDAPYDTDVHKFNALCRDCGTLHDESMDQEKCKCGGIFHVDSARCLACSKRYPFNMVGQKCNCDEKGEIVVKMVTCPGCHENSTIEHLGEHCPKCKIQLRMEG